MATTVGQHSVAAFTSPVNGTTPIDANTVRSNDNTVRVAYVDHDADPGIHVQSSTLASRPAAGTAGRKWITEDSGVYTLWFDDGTNWHPVSSESVALSVLAGETLAKGDVVKVTGWNNGQDLPEVVKVSSASDVAFAVMTAATANGTMGYATNTGIVQDVNTGSFSVGNILYPNTSGGFTATKPTSGNYQTVAFVLRSNSSNGVIYVEFSAPRIVERSDNTASTIVLRDASGNFSAGTVTAALTGNASTATTLQTARNINGVSFNGSADITVTAAAGTLTGTTLASNVVSSSLTSVGTLGSLTVTNPISGSVTGNAGTATALQTARNINGVSFNGTADITVAAAAGTLTGSTLASGVTASSLTSVGTLTGLTVSGTSSLNGATVINDAGADVDFRVESDTDPNMLFVDASTNRVGVGTNTPARILDVNGDMQVNGLRLGRGNGNLDTSCAFGLAALNAETTSGGGYNVAIGDYAMRVSTDASQCVAVGDEALYSLTTGDYNTAVGAVTVWATTTGARNTGVGFGALYDNSTGSDNTAVGYNAGYGSGAPLSNTTGTNNTFIGNGAVGSSATASNVITLGNSSIATLRCQVTTITSLSDARDKTEIVDLPVGLEFVKALQPRAFVWNMRDGGKVGVPEYGFIAQELQAAEAQLNVDVPNLIHDDNPERLEASAGVLVPILVQAIKQLEARVAALEAV